MAEAAQLMTGRGVGSVIVMAGGGAPLGIVTDRDLRVNVVAQGLASNTPVSSIMSSPLLSVDPTRPAFDALLEMTRRGIHHMGVVTDGRLAGMVSSHDIILLQGAHPVGLMREIEAQGSLEGLAAVAPRVHAVVRWLAEEGASAYDIGRIVAELNDRLVRGALGLAVASLEATGRGARRSPTPGSPPAARGAASRRSRRTRRRPGLSRPAGGTGVDRCRLLRPARRRRHGRGPCQTRVSPLRGRVHGLQPALVPARGGVARPLQLVDGGSASRGGAAASIFFDLRPIAGDERLGQGLWDFVCERAPARTLFLRHMAKAALERHAPLGFFGGFVVERSGTHKDRLDLKARGVFPMTQALRVYALSLGMQETNTVERLLAAGRRGVFAPAEVDELRDAYEVISRLRLNHQLACLDAGRVPDNFLDPKTLRKADRVLLKEAFKAIARLQSAIEDRFHTEMVS